MTAERPGIEAEFPDDELPRPGELERTEIDADERLDGDVDAAGAVAIRHRNE